MGEQGDHAAWLIVQHSDLDTVFQNQSLRLMTIAANQHNTSGANFAYLIDRYLVNKGLPQIYGTHFSGFIYKDGKAIEMNSRPIKDPETVDERRKSVGLPPLSEYKRMAFKHFQSEN